MRIQSSAFLERVFKNPRCFTESKGKICVKTQKSLKDYTKSHEAEALGRASVEEFGAGPLKPRIAVSSSRDHEPFWRQLRKPECWEKGTGNHAHEGSQYCKGSWELCPESLKKVEFQNNCLMFWVEEILSLTCGAWPGCCSLSSLRLTLRKWRKYSRKKRFGKKELESV